jgi:hypothetical protein
MAMWRLQLEGRWMQLCLRGPFKFRISTRDTEECRTNITAI